MKSRYSLNRRIVAGWIIGLAVPFICIPLVIALLSWAQNFPYSRIWDKFTVDILTQSKVISLAIIPNLAVFYFFLNKERYDLARGIIIGSACFLPFILYANFIR
jgi:hypothetical protein